MRHSTPGSNRPAGLPPLAQARGSGYIGVMTTWHLHPLNARHGLTRILSDIRAAARLAVARVGEHADLPDFDLVIRAATGAGHPKGGLAARSPAPGVIEMAQDVDRFDPDLFIRALVRHACHLIRWDGPGYGKSLGEALVSEGLAGHFVVQVLGGQPDAVDATVPAPGAARLAMNEWARRDYDHARWFMGGGDLKNGTGFGLAHRLIAAHLATNSDSSAASLAQMRADDFRTDLRRLIAADGTDPVDEATPDQAGPTPEGHNAD